MILKPFDWTPTSEKVKLQLELCQTYPKNNFQAKKKKRKNKKSDVHIHTVDHLGWAGPRGPGLRNASDVSAYVAVDRPWSRLPPPRRPCLFPTKQKNQIAEQLRGEAPRRPAAAAATAGEGGPPGPSPPRRIQWRRGRTRRALRLR